MAGYVAAMQQSGKSIEEIKEAIGNMGDLPKISDIKLAIEDILAGHSQQYVDALQSVNKRLGELKGSSKKKGSLAYEIGRLEKVGDVLEGIVSGKISPSETLLSELSVDVKTIIKNSLKDYRPPPSLYHWNHLHLRRHTYTDNQSFI